MTNNRLGTLQQRVHSAQRPDDWKLDKLHQVFRVCRSNKNTGMKEDNLLSLSYGRIIQKDIETVDGLLPENFEGYQIVEPGSIVLRLTDLQNDKRSLRQGLVTQRGIITSAYDAVEVQRDNDPRFWFYSLLALDLAKHYYSLGGGVRQSVKFADFPNDWVYRPDLATQRLIADFLDRETARIDLLIEKKQRLVALLREKLRSTITETLSKGLQKSAPLKSTGLDWLPEVPEHWTVQPLRTLIWYQEGPGILAMDFCEEGVPLLRIKGLSGREATLAGCNYLDPEKVKTRWKHFCVEVGDYLISASATTGGIATEVTETTAGAVPYTGIIRIKPRRNGYLREIIPLFLLSTLFEEQIALLSAGSTIQHFGPSHLSQMKAPLPPANEQTEIASRLSMALARTEDTMAKVNTSIDRLKEYRSALITAAVTGQIDVSTYAKSGTADRRLDAIKQEMGA